MVAPAVEAARLVVRMTLDSAQFRRDAAEAEGIVGRLGSSFQRSIAFAVGYTAVNEIFKGMGAFAKAADDAVIGLNSSLEQSQLRFEALTGSAEVAKNLVSELNMVAENSTFGIAQLQGGAAQMLAFGVHAQNVVPLVQAMQTAAAASGGDIEDKFKRINYAISEINSGIPLSARQLRQLATAGVPLAALADELHVTTAALYESGKTGEITAGQFTKAFADMYNSGRLGDFMEKQTQTFSGALAVIKTNVQLAAAQTFKPLFDEIQHVTVALGNFVRSADFTYWASFAQESVRLLGGEIDSLVQKFAPLGTAVKTAFAEFGKGNVGGGVDAITKPFKDGLNGIISLITSFTGQMGTAGSNLVTTFAQGMVDAIGTTLNDAVTFIAQFIADFFIGHSPPPQGPLSEIQNGGKLLIETYAEGMYQGLTPVQAVGLEVAQAIQGPINGMTFDQAKAMIADAAGNLTAMKAAADTVADAILSIKHAVDDLAVAMASVTYQMDVIKAGFKEQLDYVDKQIEAINRSMSPDLNRKKSELELQKQINDVNLKKLNDEVNSPDYDKQIRDLQKKERTTGVDSTDLVDREIRQTQDALKELSDGVNSVSALNDRINALKQTIANPKSDVQEKQINDLMKERQNAGAEERALIDARLGGLRQQYVGQKKADDDKKVAVDAEVQRLEDIKAQQTLIDNEKKRQLELDLQGYQDAKAQIEDNNKKAKEGLQAQITALQDAKADQDNKYASELKSLGLQDQIMKLQDQQLDLNKQILLLPLQQQRQDIVDKENDALAPLQKQLDAYKLQSEQLSLIDKQWQAINADVRNGVSDLSGKKAKPGSSDDQPDLIHKSLEDPAVTALKDRMRDLGKQAAEHFAQGISDWFTEHKDDLIAGGLGAIIGGAIFGPLGAIAGGIFAVKLFDKVRELITGEKSIDVYDEFGKKLGSYHETKNGWADQLAEDVQKGFDKVKKVITDSIQAIKDALGGGDGSGNKINIYDEFGKSLGTFETDAKRGDVAQFIGGLTAAFRDLSDWAENHGGAVETVLTGIAVILAGLALTVAPGASLLVGLGLLTAIFLEKYETNNDFHNFVDSLIGLFEHLANAVNAANDAIGNFFGLSDPNKAQREKDQQAAQAQINAGQGMDPLPDSDLNPNRTGKPDIDPGVGGFGNNPGIHASDFADAAQLVGDLFDKIGTGAHRFIDNNVNVVKNIGDAFNAVIRAFSGGDQGVLGNPTGSPVAAGDLNGLSGEVDTFVQHIQDQLGDHGDAQEAVKSFKQRIIDDMGHGSSAEQAVKDAEDQFNSSFGDNKGVQVTLSSFQTFINGIFGQGKTLSGLLGNSGGDLDTTLNAAKTLFDNSFGVNGMQNPVTGFKKFIDGIFGEGKGALSTLFTGDATNVVKNLVALFTNTFGTDGQGARAPVRGYADFIKGIFQNGGDLDQYVKVFGPVLDAAMPGDVAPIAGFVKSVGDTIRQIGSVFKIPAMESFKDPDVSYHSTSKNYAKGVFNSTAEGHWALVGEEGPEPMFVPKGSTILPNHLGKALGMLPGHADGYNVPNFDLVGPWDGIAKYVSKTTNDAISKILDQHRPKSGGNIPGSGFQAMELDAYMAYMSMFGGPLDNPSAFADLMDVGREKGVDPRWFMAIMQTEDHYGTDANDRLPAYNNYGGMGIRVPGLGFPSPIYATDGGPQPYAAFNSFHDFLEDEADWIRENGTSFAGYQTADQGEGKNAAFRAILAAIPDIAGATGAVGAQAGAGWQDVVAAASAMMNDPSVNGTNWNDLCEKFAEQAERNAGYDQKYWKTAAQHAYGVPHNLGWGPPGSMQHWGTDYDYQGHAAINLDGAGMVIGTSPQGIKTYSMLNAADNIGWIPPGLAMGGVAYDPMTVTVGDIPGRVPEIIAPQPMMKDTVKQALTESGHGATVVKVTVNLYGNPGPNIEETRRMIVTEVPKVLKKAMAEIGR